MQATSLETDTHTGLLGRDSAFGLTAMQSALGRTVMPPDNYIPQTVDADEMDRHYALGERTINTTMTAGFGAVHTKAEFFDSSLTLKQASAHNAVGGFLREWHLFVQHSATQCFWADAKEQLADLDAYAAETEMSPPSPVAKALAERLLMEIIPAVPRYYGISPWEDGDIVIQANKGRKNSVSVYCRAKGGASLYIIRPEGGIHDRHYRPPETIAASEIIEALRKMQS